MEGELQCDAMPYATADMVRDFARCDTRSTWCSSTRKLCVQSCIQTDKSTDKTGHYQPESELSSPRCICCQADAALAHTLSSPPVYK